MKRTQLRSLALLLVLLALPALACGLLSDGSTIPNNAVVVDVTANTSLQPWFSQVVNDFNESETETAAGDPVYILPAYTEAGTFIAQLAGDAAVTADLWLPDDDVWTAVLADQGDSGYQGNCTSVAESPLVIGMWREAAESLGWPGLPLGWLDVGSLAADPSAWNYYSGGEFGSALRLSHTHPGLSGAGANTLLALVHAAEAKTDSVTPDDIEQPIVQASVGAFESAVAFFGSDTLELGATMYDRGASYLGAAVMYESTVVEFGRGEIVPVYPLEGTFIATHPACIYDGASAEVQEAAGLFRDYLLSESAQQVALNRGLRPVNEAIELGSPLDAANGVDLNQPEIVFNSPTVDAVYAAQDLWQSARKDVNLVMLLDTSGSMRGIKIDSMRQAAVQFVEQMGDDDYITIITFDTQPNLLVDRIQVAEARTKVIDAIRGIEAAGDTALFDAIGGGARIIAETTAADTTNALVVLTDGVDTGSTSFGFNQELVDLAAANDTTIFTIAYGGDADEDTLGTLALEANGNFYLGDEASIAAIYEDMSAAFGGAVGVGR